MNIGNVDCNLLHKFIKGMCIARTHIHVHHTYIYVCMRMLCVLHIDTFLKLTHP